MNQQSQERRSFNRLHDSLVIRHRPLGSKSGKERSVSRNLSAHGLALPTTRRMAPHSVLELEIMIPMQILPVFALGEIVWTKKEWESAHRLYDIGIQITDIDEDDEGRIQHYVKERIEESAT